MSMPSVKINFNCILDSKEHSLASMQTQHKTLFLALSALLPGNAIGLEVQHIETILDPGVGQVNITVERSLWKCILLDILSFYAKERTAPAEKCSYPIKVRP